MALAPGVTAASAARRGCRTRGAGSAGSTRSAAPSPPRAPSVRNSALQRPGLSAELRMTGHADPTRRRASSLPSAPSACCYMPRNLSIPLHSCACRVQSVSAESRLPPLPADPDAKCCVLGQTATGYWLSDAQKQRAQQEPYIVAGRRTRARLCVLSSAAVASTSFQARLYSLGSLACAPWLRQECNDRERLLAGACVGGCTEVTLLEDKEAERPMVFNGDGGDEVEIAHMGNYFAQVVKVRTRAGVFVWVHMRMPCVRARVNTRTRRLRHVENMRLC